MKDQSQNNGGPMNFGILGISRGANDPIPQQAAPSEQSISHDNHDPMAGLRVQTTVPASFTGKMISSERPASPFAAGISAILNDEELAPWLLGQTSFTGDIIDGPSMSVRDVAEPTEIEISEFNASELHYDELLKKVRDFANDLTHNLEANAAALELSTNDLVAAKLNTAITVSLCKLLGVSPDEAGNATYPSHDVINDNIQNYEIFELMIRENILSDGLIAKYGSAITGLDPEWERILNRAISEITDLSVDDSLTITDILAATWCEEIDDYNAAVSTSDFMDQLTSHGDCDDDDDYEENDCISITLETEVDDGGDCITVTGIDNRSVTFFVDFNKVLIEASASDFDIEAWSWLKHMMPAMIFKTINPQMFLNTNRALNGEMRFVELMQPVTSNETILALYTFESGAFPTDDADGYKMLAVLDFLFHTNIQGTPLSQYDRVISIIDQIAVPEDEIIEMLADNDIVVNPNGRQYSEETVKTAIDAAVDIDTTTITFKGEISHPIDLTEPTVPVATENEPTVEDEKLAALGRQAAESLASAPVAPVVETPVKEQQDDSGDFILKPIRSPGK